ncbi:endonuclease/exonuclease/phosphatase family protein [Tautonia plasticadhaerens]|uniref:Endonuclease/Exonuclease/phosphatase family protein n=1 Tax=Tautonia plasticadhaerens TaxID=2527974 RepID=A0A518GW18_9BACT|nr:endonuclease/exonuclease/phosphatase family protein [Tautonia plasticadhaerens]QDV32796.1 Endonuclease/Exonuclease/phosphatase family protein [Tautonia plasticadhaerens]
MILLLSIALALPPADADAPGADLRVMSFNIRYGTADDGENAWPNRKDFLVETIRGVDPDLLGTQETLGFQRDDLARALPEYTVLAAGRDDGKESGEMMALFYRTDRFEELRSGHFWLSETPDEVGSKSWDSSLPRMVTWAELRDRKAGPGSPPIAVFNTHFDHRGPQARLESARLIRRKVAELAPNSRVVVTGDFNAGEGSDPYEALFDPEAEAPPLVDSYRVAHPEPSPEGEGTFSNFRAGATTGPRIDWIACSPDWEVKRADIVPDSRDGRTPSDHLPVTAILAPKAGADQD